jgi:hypothetical protein
LKPSTDFQAFYFDLHLLARDAMVPMKSIVCWRFPNGMIFLRKTLLSVVNEAPKDASGTGIKGTGCTTTEERI